MAITSNTPKTFTLSKILVETFSQLSPRQKHSTIKPKYNTAPHADMCLHHQRCIHSLVKPASQPASNSQPNLSNPQSPSFQQNVFHASVLHTSQGNARLDGSLSRRLTGLGDRLACQISRFEPCQVLLVMHEFLGWMLCD